MAVRAESEDLVTNMARVERKRPMQVEGVSEGTGVGREGGPATVSFWTVG